MLKWLALQISIAVAALAVYVPAEDWGDGGIVNWLRDEMNSHPEYIPGFLELLTVLPEVYIKSRMLRIYICDVFSIFQEEERHRYFLQKN